MKFRVDLTERKICETLVMNGFISEKSVNIVFLRQKFGDSRLFSQIGTSLNPLLKDNLSEYLK